MTGRQWNLLLGALLVLLCGTAVLRLSVGSISQQEIPERQRQLAEDALRESIADFDARKRRLTVTARNLASDRALIQGLSELPENEDSATDLLVSVMARLDLPVLLSTEVYDRAPRIRAWNGFSMPMDSAPADEAFLKAPQVRMARDTDRRAALVVWYPIFDGTRAVGAIRVMELVLARMPVRNEYLSDVSLAEDWRHLTGLNVEVDYEARAGTDRRVLTDEDGVPILSLRAVAPEPDNLVRSERARYDHLAALWAGLLMLLGAIRVVGALSTSGRNRWLRLWGVWAVVGLWRISWMVLRIPERWQGGKRPLAPLFDPEHLASDWGWGLFRTSGDMALTAIAFLVIAILTLREAARARQATPGWGAWPLRNGALFGVACTGLFWVLSGTVHHVVLDSTLDYFARSGLLPQRLVVVVFGALLVLGLAASMIAVAVGRASLGPARSGDSQPATRALIGLCASLVIGAVLWWWTGDGAPGLEAAGLFLFGGVTFAVAVSLPYDERWPRAAFYLRSILLVVVLLAVVMYPLLDRAVEAKERLRMEDAAQSFVDDRDPRVQLAIAQICREIKAVLPGSEMTVEETLEELLRGSLLASLGTYEVSVALLSDDGTLIGRNAASRSPTALARALQQDKADLELMRAIRAELQPHGVTIEKITSPVELDRFDYIGIDETEGGNWLLVRASQHEHLPSGNTPFPRVLVPAGYYGSLYPDLSIAEFREGVLVRSFGSTFGRSFLDAGVGTAMETRESLLLEERIRDRNYVTWYARNQRPGQRVSAGRSIIAVRRSAVNLFDRLYYLLRLTVSGLILGLPVYAFGFIDRLRIGEVPATRIRFRDKVLNAFFAVGLIVVVAMGWVGLRVVTGETDRAVESWLRQHLDRVEDALALRAGPNEMPYQVLERLDVDSLAAQVALDLNIYLRTELESTSRPQLVRDRLISQRIPIEAYDNLFVGGFRFASVNERLGNFVYTAGYRALPDEQGVPRYVVSVQTLPEQERIEEERARTAAYLFGALLLLMMVVMVTASVIAGALSRPVARLQQGLQNVAEGRFDRMGPLKSRDEIADLVGTFNSMQDQLAESRRLLAHQERQLAWREMAQQVAHEIKNPLTPMKLSVQHLRRAHEEEADTEGSSKFKGLLHRITATLVDQINAMAKIADEFSAFARMPLQAPEKLDLNEVLSEAVGLMQEHASVTIECRLADEALYIEADRDSLRRMYINFIKNALEALEPGRAGLIVVSSRREFDSAVGYDMAVSEVKDNGQGVPVHLRSRIFTPSFSTKTSGTGLGLAIAKNTAEELRGRIGFESEEGKGSVFWVRFPLMLKQERSE